MGEKPKSPTSQKDPSPKERPILESPQFCQKVLSKWKILTTAKPKSNTSAKDQLSPVLGVGGTMATGLGTTATRVTNCINPQVLPILITEKPVSNMEYKTYAAIVKIHKE